VYIFFAAQFDALPSHFGVWNDTELFPKTATATGTRVGGFVELPNAVVEMKIAVSFISIDLVRFFNFN
jgi:putative alpha-1,2-mannosidase